MATAASVTPAVDANTVLVTRWSSNAIRPESGREGPADVVKILGFKTVVPKPREGPADVVKILGFKTVVPKPRQHLLTNWSL